MMRQTHLAVALLSISCFMVPSFAQPVPDPPPSNPAACATFPIPRADLPYLPAKWPQRWGRVESPIQGVIVDLDAGAALRGVRTGAPMFIDPDSKDAKALLAANITGLKEPKIIVDEGPGSFRYV